MLRASTSAAIAKALRLQTIAPRRFKFGNVPVVCQENGYRFDSRKEAHRWAELRWRENAGQITELAVHPVFMLTAHGQHIGRFTPDFSYLENGELVVEDVKSEPTRKLADYRLRVKLFRACYPTVRFVEAI